jgi:glycerophosphoryl diester phosphodiesterase
LISIGHRGAAGHAPENTLLSIEKALSLGADWIEIDVRAVENELIVIHDATLKRTTNGKGSIYQKTIPYLRSLNAGQGQRLPLLFEVFDLVNGKAGINIELKGPGTVPLIITLVERQIQNNRWSYKNIIVSSYDKISLKQVKTQQHQIQTGLICKTATQNQISEAETLNVYSIHPYHRFLRKSFVTRAHRKGFRIFPYTVNQPKEILRMKRLGVDGIFTDYPERVRSVSIG